MALARPNDAPLFSDHLAVICERARLALDACGYQALLLCSGQRKEVFRDDIHYPYRVNAPFKVFAPLVDAPQCFIYFRAGQKPLLVFHREEDYWHLPAELPADDWVQSFELRAVSDWRTARATLPAQLSDCAFIGEPFPELTSLGVRAVNPEHLLHRLDFDRAVKTPYELAMMRSANRRGALGHHAAESAFRAGASEFGIELAFLAAAEQREQDLPYNPIIALNEAGAVLHYQVLRSSAPQERRSLLIDAGAEYAGYASDITRTYAANNGEFAALIAAMDRLQLGLCALCIAGADWRDIHVAAYERIGALLAETGIVRCSVAEAVETGLVSVFFPHGIGHLLGLQVHDAGGRLANAQGQEIPRPAAHPFLRLTRKLEPGFVVTMEPGLYFIDALLQQAAAGAHRARIDWQKIAALKPYGGIRIEDNLAVRTSGAPENLTRDAFGTLP
jgi:Xaa-Pro dipeptidase